MQLTPELLEGMTPQQHMALAIDTPDPVQARYRSQLAHDAGGLMVNVGLEYLTSQGPRACSTLAEEHRMEWLADFNIYANPGTLSVVVRNLVQLPKPPFGITVSTKSGVEALTEAQAVAEEAGVMLFGMGLLPTIGPNESHVYERNPPVLVVRSEADRAHQAHIGGVVCSALELAAIKANDRTRGMVTLIPDTPGIDPGGYGHARSLAADEAMAAGADLLVVGQEVTSAQDPGRAYQQVALAVGAGMMQRAEDQGPGREE